MPPPTTAIGFSGTTPPAPPGLQNTVPQSDGAQPFQRESNYMPLAVPGPGGLAGAVKPDGTSITMDADGTIHAAAAGAGGGGGGTSASGGLYVCVSPTQDPADGTRTQFILPAPQLAGTIGWLVRNDTMQRQLGTKAYFSVQGTQLTLKYPLEADADSYLEYYYIQGTPNSQSGGGGSVTPLGSPTFIQGASNYGTGNSLTCAFATNNSAGSCLIVDAIYQENFNGAGSLSISDSQGNTYVSAGTHERNNVLVKTWYALNCAGGPNTVTITYSTTTTHPGMAVAIHEYGAVKAVSAFDVDAYGFADSTGGLPIALSLTTTVAGDLLHLYGACETGGGTGISNSGTWASRENNNAGTVAVATFDALATAAGAVSNSINTDAVGLPTFIQAYLLALKSI